MSALFSVLGLHGGDEIHVGCWTNKVFDLTMLISRICHHGFYPEQVLFMVMGPLQPRTVYMLLYLALVCPSNDLKVNEVFEMDTLLALGA